MLKVLFYNDNTWLLSFLVPLLVCRDIRMTVKTVKSYDLARYAK